MVTIYAFTCEVNNKAYIGCTTGPLAKRFREHRSLLKKGLHSEKDLLRDWLMYGPEKFHMVPVLQTVDDAPVPVKRALETYVMQKYKQEGLLYNRNEACFQPTPEAIAKGVPVAHQKPGNRWTPEANMKRSLSQLGIPKGHGAKISATKQAKKLMR